MKTFFFKLMLLFLPMLAGIALINYRIDPLHLFYGSYYEKAGVLLKDHNIVFESSDEKKLLVEFLKHKNDSDVLVFGSSRTAIIDSQHLNKPVLNLCTSHVLLEDVVAAYGLYISNHEPPKEIYIGLDPWYFNDHKINDEAFYLQPHYAFMLEKMQAPAKVMQIPVLKEMGIYDKSKQLFSFNYLQNSMVSILRNGFAESGPKLASSNDLFVKQSNGVLHYKDAWQANPDDVETAVRRELSAENLHGTKGYEELSPGKLKLLENFLDYLRNQKISVTLLLTPYHPEIWKHVLSHQRYHIILQAEKRIHEIGENKNIQVTGSFDPGTYGLQQTDFYDAIHINYKGVEKIVHTGLN